MYCSYVTDATVAIFISILLFIIPSGISNNDRDKHQTGKMTEGIKNQLPE